MNVAALESLNPGVSPTALQIGEVLQLQASASTYTIQAGDTYSSIAAKLGTTVAILEAANPTVNAANLEIGSQISVPSTPATVPAPAQPAISTQSPPSSSTYTVKAGDTFSSIATALGTTIAALEEANPKASPTNLQVGDQLSIPTASPPIFVTSPAPVAPLSSPTPVATAPASRTYTIQAGDTFTKIAAKYGISVASLEAANPTDSPTSLQVGEVIKIPSITTPTPTVQPIPAPLQPPIPTPAPLISTPAPALPSVPSSSTYTIHAGDTLSTIAFHFSVSLASLEAANPSLNPAILAIGQTISLPPGTTNPSQASTSSSTTGIGGPFIMYSGPWQSYPPPSQWASYSALWAQNAALMSYNDSPSEISFVKSAIDTVSAESGVDARVILCIIMQESGGNVRVGNTFNGVVNTGIMQAFNGVSFDPNNVQGSILQMVRDGVEGTASGPGLVQAYSMYRNWYEAARKYNSGSVDVSQLNNAMGATANYVVDFANRLMGHVWVGM